MAQRQEGLLECLVAPPLCMCEWVFTVASLCKWRQQVAGVAKQQAWRRLPPPLFDERQLAQGLLKAAFHAFYLIAAAPLDTFDLTQRASSHCFHACNQLAVPLARAPGAFRAGLR